MPPIGAREAAAPWRGSGQVMAGLWERALPAKGSEAPGRMPERVSQVYGLRKQLRVRQLYFLTYMKWWKLSFFPSLDGRIQCPQIIHKSCFVVKVKLFHLVISNNEKTTNLIGLKPVSYTHLTLPTICSV